MDQATSEPRFGDSPPFPSGSGHTPARGKLAFIAGFGLSPLWLAIVLLWLGARGAGAEYWTAAPWLLLVALPACLITLLIALATLAVYDRSSGIESRRRSIAINAFLLLVIAVTAATGVLWLRHEQKQREIEIEQRLVLDFVREEKRVAEAAGGPFTTSLMATTLVQGTPVRYEVAVYAPNTVYALVDVARSPSGPVFSLACVTPLSLGKRDPFKDPCRQ